MSPRKIGHMLRATREAKGLTQAEVAKRAEVTVTYLSLLENGRKSNLSVAVLVRLAKALGVEPGELLK